MLDKLEDTNDFSVPLYIKAPYEYMNTVLMDVDISESAQLHLINYWVHICTRFNDYNIDQPVSIFLKDALFSLKRLNKEYNDDLMQLQLYEDSMKKHYPGLLHQITKSKQLHITYKEKNYNDLQ